MPVVRRNGSWSEFFASPRLRYSLVMTDSSKAPDLPDATLALIEVLPIHVWTARPDGALDFVSARGASDFGIPATQLVEEGWLQVLHPDDIPGTIARWTRSLQTGEPYSVEFRLRRENGEFEWYLARAEAQRDLNGKITRWIGTNTNVHSQHELQERTEALLDAVGRQSRETQEKLATLLREKEAAERRVRELENDVRR